VVQAPTEAMPERCRALVTLAIGTGLRQGEAFGLTVDRDFFLRLLTVDRQRVPNGPLEDIDQPAQPARKPATWWEAWRSSASPVMS
jgi:hypothetical protein